VGYNEWVRSVRPSQLSIEQKHYLSLWQEAVRLAEGTKHDPSDIYHALCNLELMPEEQLDGGFIRAGRA
jgi:hypothetical protein